MTPLLRIRILEQELREALADNANLRKRLQESSLHARRVEAAYYHATRMVLWMTGGIYPSRDWSLQHGMSQRQWENAIGLLRMARVVVGERRWVSRDLVHVKAKLERERQYAIDYPDAYKARLNKHGRG